ncbi:hypothetical protein V8F20_011113 [Naviculisporaceae sp. PSN 640]
MFSRFILALCLTRGARPAVPGRRSITIRIGKPIDRSLRVICVMAVCFACCRASKTKGVLLDLLKGLELGGFWSHQKFGKQSPGICPIVHIPIQAGYAPISNACTIFICAVNQDPTSSSRDEK